MLQVSVNKEENSQQVVNQEGNKFKFSWGTTTTT